MLVDVLGLLSVGGDVAADGSEALGTGATAEFSADFGLKFHHAQVSLGRVVIERQAEVSSVSGTRVMDLGSTVSALSV